MIGNMGERLEDLKTSEGTESLSESEFETAEALFTYYETQRGVKYGSEKRNSYITRLGKFIKAMKEINIDPLRYVNWVLSEYEPAYINMLLSKNNLKRYASTDIMESKGYYFRSSKIAIRTRKEYGMSDIDIYDEIKIDCNPLLIYMHIQKGGIDRERVDDYDDLKYEARVQWQVLGNDAKKDLLEFFDLDELRF